MLRDLSLYLDEILNSIAKIRRYTADLSTVEEFAKDEETFDAVVMNLQVIGEAVKQIPSIYRETYPQIDWKGTIGLRDIISHTYASLDEDMIWDIVQNELTELQHCIMSVKENLGN